MFNSIKAKITATTTAIKTKATQIKQDGIKTTVTKATQTIKAKTKRAYRITKIKAKKAYRAIKSVLSMAWELLKEKEFKTLLVLATILVMLAVVVAKETVLAIIGKAVKKVKTLSQNKTK